MNRNKAVFLDRDGTINVDRGYISSPKDFVLLPKVIDGLKATGNVVTVCETKEIIKILHECYKTKVESST